MVLLYGVTLFVSAALLFCLQPIVGKLVLPLLGGTPAVWNTCMVFFQAALLAGYVYAHLTTAWLGVRRQAGVHAVLLFLPLLVLPIGVAGYAVQEVPQETNPLPWLLGVLVVSAGLPFFVVATTAPLLQKWFAATGHAAARDPYFLYAASNLGSVLALVSYPLALEPLFELPQQGWLWGAGYALFIVLTLGCAAALWRAPGRTAKAAGTEPPTPPQEGAQGGQPRLTGTRRLRWLLLAFVPSSLLLGVTSYLSTDIAAIPLLWVVPLAVYLFTFILAFAEMPVVPRAVARRALPIFAVLLAFLFLVDDLRPPTWLLIPLHLLGFFVAALVCHRELADDRPPAADLTEFYLWLALGGVLGGLFNALVAPLVFNRVVEYPLVWLLACVVGLGLRPGLARPRVGWLDVLLPAAVGVLTAAIVWGVQAYDLVHGPARVAVMFGVPAVGCYTLVDRPLRFALGLGAMLLAGGLYHGLTGETRHIERNFFGVLRVTVDAEGKFVQLFHGNTLHGRQSLDPARRREPLAYYHRSGPLGQVFGVFGGHPSAKHVGLIGLGAGSVACYAEPGQQWTYYEIDPAVERAALEYFTFLRDCRAGVPRVVLGDGRLRLSEAPDGYYDLIVLDAFSSDAVPVHLLTREALRLYVAKLAGGGFLAFHVSNRYLNLKPVLADLARDARLVCYLGEDLYLSADKKAEGKEASAWVVMARRPADLGGLVQSVRWERLPGRANAAVWTDHYSNILSVFEWEWRPQVGN